MADWAAEGSVHYAPTKAQSSEGFDQRTNGTRAAIALHPLVDRTVWPVITMTDVCGAFVRDLAQSDPNPSRSGSIRSKSTIRAAQTQNCSKPPRWRCLAVANIVPRIRQHGAVNPSARQRVLVQQELQGFRIIRCRDFARLWCGLHGCGLGMKKASKPVIAQAKRGLAV